MLGTRLLVSNPFSNTNQGIVYAYSRANEASTFGAAAGSVSGTASNVYYGGFLQYVDLSGDQWWSDQIRGTQTAYFYDWPSTQVQAITDIHGYFVNDNGGATCFVSFSTAVHYGVRCLFRNGNTYRLQTTPEIRRFGLPPGYGSNAATDAIRAYGVHDYGLNLYFPSTLTIVSPDNTFIVYAFPFSDEGQVVVDRCRTFEQTLEAFRWNGCKAGTTFYDRQFSEFAITLLPPDPVDGSDRPFFGKAMDLCLHTPWGIVLAVGAPNTHSGRGSVYLYTITRDNFANDYTTLAPPITFSTVAHFGNALAFSGDGNILVIGAPRDADDRGNVFVYSLVTRMFEIVVPNPTAGVVGGLLGTSVSTNHRGTVIAAGRPCRGCLNEHTAGAVVIYNRLSSYSTIRQRRYATLQASPTGGIQVREIEIYVGPTNIASWKPAILTGTFSLPPRLYSLNAVDTFIDNSVAYNALSNAPSQFLIIDLGNVSAPITGVIIRNRVDCCQENLAGAIFRITDYHQNTQLYSFTLSGVASTYTFFPNV